MFIQNKYYNWYYNIINRAKSRVFEGYTEKHHIIPKSLGGLDIDENLVDLTPREHYICHLLLTKMTKGAAYDKMLYAYIIMSGRKLYNSKQYKLLREEYSEINSKLRSGKGNGMYGANRKGKNNTFYGRKHSEKTKRKLSMIQKERYKNNPDSFKHGEWTNDRRKKISESRKRNAKSFTFKHQEHGIFIGPIWQLNETYPDQKLRKDELWKLTAGHYKSYKGWTIS